MPKSASNIVSFAPFKATPEIPPLTAATENGGEIHAQDDKGGTTGNAQNSGLSEGSMNPTSQTTWGKKKGTGGSAKAPSKKPLKFTKPTDKPSPSTSPKKGVGSTPGPDGYIIDSV
jgi:hypothetical protein